MCFKKRLHQHLNLKATQPVYKKIPKGKSIDIQGATCWIPPIGFGCHSVTEQISPTDIIKRSNVASEQYWERQELPSDWEERLEIEAERQEVDPQYSDSYLDEFRRREWHRRLYGVWFYNNGDPVYLTGLNYFFLNYWELDSGYPDFRVIDVEYFYFWQRCVNDPKCYGMIEVRKRRDGKSYRAGCMLYEAVSRFERALGGIQSKDDESAAELFDKAIVPQFQGLPEFFVPVWDTAAGSTPKKTLRFFKPSKRGKGAFKSLKGPELKSIIDYRSAKPKAYDGSKTLRLVLDESGKVEHDVIKRHLMLKPCCEDNKRNIVGKMLVTSTVEEMGIKYKFDDLWDWSNQDKLLGNGATKSGLYRFFMPADRAGDYNKYGEPYTEQTRKEIMDERATLFDNPDELIAQMRKFPLTWIEAFKITSNDSLFNPVVINNRISLLSQNPSTVRGDFVWVDGIKNSSVEFIENKKGKWEVATLIPENLRNRVQVVGNRFSPLNKEKFGSGADPYQYRTVSGKGSNGTIFVKWKFSIHAQNSPFNGAVIVRYSNRPQDIEVYYDDVIKTLWFHGSELLAERNKYGLCDYMIKNGYGDFLIWLKGQKEPGIYASEDSNIELVRITESHLNKNIDKCFFIDTLEQQLKFELRETEKYDEAMGFGYALMTDTYVVPKRQEKTVTIQANKLFRQYKVPT